jgi:hypothetical protein
MILGGAAIGAVGEALTESGVYGLHVHPGSVAGAAYLVTFGVTLRAVPTVLFVAAIPAYFPDGRLPGPRWRWVRWTLIAALVATMVGGPSRPSDAPRRTGMAVHAYGKARRQPARHRSARGDPDTSRASRIAGLSRWRRGAIVRQQLLLFACIVTVLFLSSVLVQSTSRTAVPRLVGVLGCGLASTTRRRSGDAQPSLTFGAQRTERCCGC